MEAIGDVVLDEDIYRVGPKIQVKMQSRHNLMQNIQNISKLVMDIENGIVRYSLILKSMEEHKAMPHYRLMGDFTIPIVDTDAAMAEINGNIDRFAKDLEKHHNQLRSMQLQHDGLTKEIDLLMEIEKGKYEAGKLEAQKKKDKLKRRRN